jgi:two-component sensor histidine kinase
VTQGVRSGRRIVGMAHPLLGEDGEVRLVGVLGLDLARLSAAMATPALGPGAAALVLDAGGTVMAGWPSGVRWIGERAPSALAAIGDDAREAEGLDGVRRLWGMAALVEGEGLRVAVGVPVLPLRAQADQLFLRRASLLTGVFALAALAAWATGEAAIRRPLNALRRASDRLAAGDLTARSGARRTAPELAALASSFDAMAESLQRRESELRAALADRELLVRETNHRVKNGLQLVASMLGLQAASLADAEARRHLVEAQARVAAVARVHERLHRSEQLGTVAFGAYLRELCADLGNGASAAGSAGRVVVEAAAAELPVERALPLALIANELVTNALKHAYPAGEEGLIAVRFETSVGGDGMRLEVADRGVGLPTDLREAERGGLGMTLVRALVRQLDGRLHVEHGSPGTRFVVAVPA